MKGIKLFLGTLAILMLCATMAMAQSKSSKSKKKPSASDKKNARKEVKAADESFWTTKMWYGADINYPTLAPGFFNMGLSPRIAYKLTNKISAGIVLKTDYTYYRNIDPSISKKFESFDYGGGFFARARIFRGLFAQGEYERSVFHFPTAFDYNLNKYVIEKTSQPYAYLGLGWSSGFGKWQTQIGINRNVLYNDNSIRGLWDFKFGITYNF